MSDIQKFDDSKFRNVEVQTVNFYGDSLKAVKVDGVVYVPIRRVCESIGIDFSSQIKKLKANPVAVVVEWTTTGPDGKQYDTCMVDLRHLAIWLAGISISKVRIDIRQKLYLYQMECKTVLHKHFFGQDDDVPPAASPKPVVDVTPAPQAPQPSTDLTFLAPQAEHALRIAKSLFFLDGNEAAIKANQLMKRFHGVDLLEAAGMKALPAQVQESHINVTEIGKLIGLGRNDVNPFLIKHGFQVKVPGGAPPYEPTPKGLPFAHMVNHDLSREDGSNMNSVPQLRWYTSVVPVLRELLGQS